MIFMLIFYIFLESWKLRETEMLHSDWEMWNKDIFSMNELSLEQLEECKLEHKQLLGRGRGEDRWDEFYTASVSALTRAPFPISHIHNDNTKQKLESINICSLTAGNMRIENYSLNWKENKLNNCAHLPHWKRDIWQESKVHFRVGFSLKSSSLCRRAKAFASVSVSELCWRECCHVSEMF